MLLQCVTSSSMEALVQEKLDTMIPFYLSHEKAMISARQQKTLTAASKQKQVRIEQGQEEVPKNYRVNSGYDQIDKTTKSTIGHGATSDRKEEQDSNRAGEEDLH